VAVDPICAVEVKPDPALSAEVRGQKYYFCSKDCRTIFLSDPEGYAKLKSFEKQAGPGHQ
jgi:YHS domain-containing protein